MRPWPSRCCRWAPACRRPIGFRSSGACSAGEDPLLTARHGPSQRQPARLVILWAHIDWLPHPPALPRVQLAAVDRLHKFPRCLCASRSSREQCILPFLGLRRGAGVFSRCPGAFSLVWLQASSRPCGGIGVVRRSFHRSPKFPGRRGTGACKGTRDSFLVSERFSVRGWKDSSLGKPAKLTLCGLGIPFCSA